MRSIYYLFTRFYVLIFFVLLEVFALTLVYKSHKYQEVRFLEYFGCFYRNRFRLCERSEHIHSFGYQQ
jgi:hypothetical protein